MANISNVIEEFLLDMLGEDSSVNISRNELATYFSCAPSQINYVLSTRFSVDRGYVIESRRGGGGYVNLIKITYNNNDILSKLANINVSDGISQNKAVQILARLCSENIITENEAELLTATISDKAIIVPSIIKDEVRAGIFKNLGTTLLKKQDKMHI